MNKRILLLPATVLAAGLAGCGNPGGGELAIVNGETITLEQFHRHLESKPVVSVTLANGQTVNARVNDTLAFQGLSDLLRQRLILQMARDYGVAPTDEEVTAELKFRQRRDPRFVENLRNLGVNLGQIRESLEVDLARERLITRGVEVTDGEVERFIEENPRQFEEPETINALWIFLQDPALRRTVDEELNQGRGFAAVAARYSQFRDPNLRPGAFPQTIVENIPEPLRTRLRNTGENQSTDWIQLDDGWAKFYVEQKRPRTKVTIDDTMRQTVKRQLAMARGARANDIERALTERLKASAERIEIRFRELENPWERAIEQLKEAEEDIVGTPGQGEAAPAAPGAAPPAGPPAKG
jgi:parvulin-like peptidyl-prolyl isomerase